MRIFYAVTFYDDTKEAIARVRDLVANHCEKGRFTLTENLHLTLEFIGEVKATDLRFYVDILDKISVCPEIIRMDSLGSFKKRGTEIVWLGMEKNAGLMGLHNQLRGLLVEDGFEPEKGKFKPHITLGRQVEGWRAGKTCS